jgi:dynein heavy chain
MELLLNYTFLSDEDIRLNSMTFTWPQRILPIIDVSRKRITQKTDRLRDDLKNRVFNLTEELNGVAAGIQKFNEYGSLAESAEYVKKLKAYEIHLSELYDAINAINVEQELFGWDKIPLDTHTSAAAALEPFKKLWETATVFQAEFAKWNNGPFVQLAPAQMEEDIANIQRIMFGLVKSFVDMPVPKKVAENIKTKVMIYDYMFDSNNCFTVGEIQGAFANDCTFAQPGIARTTLGDDGGNGWARRHAGRHDAVVENGRNESRTLLCGI